MAVAVISSGLVLLPATGASDPRVGLAAAVLVVLGGAVGWSVRRRRGVVAVG